MGPPYIKPCIYCNVDNQNSLASLLLGHQNWMVAVSSMHNVYKNLGEKQGVCNPMFAPKTFAPASIYYTVFLLTAFGFYKGNW